MNPKKDPFSPTESMAEMRETLQELFLVPARDFDRAVEEQNLNVEYIGRINDVALRGAHTLVTRQGAALRETFDELSSVLKDAAAKANHPAATDAHLRCFELSVARGVEHLRIAFDWANEINLATWDLLTERLETSLGEAKSSRSKAGKDSLAPGHTEVMSRR